MSKKQEPPKFGSADKTVGLILFGTPFLIALGVFVHVVQILR